MTNTMTYRGYVASMTFDAEDKIIVGRVLDVDDIISFTSPKRKHSGLRPSRAA